MSTETPGYLDAIKHLPEGGTLHLQDVTWKEYEELVERRDEVSHVRLSFDGGRLEIMSPSAEHERYARLFEHRKAWRLCGYILFTAPRER